MPSRFQPIQAGTDQSQQLAMINKNFAELDAEGTKKLFYDSSGIPSIQIGVQQDGSSRIKVSKPGVDVTTATDSQLTFNSAQNVFKIISTGVIATPDASGFTASTGKFNATSSSNSVAHNLGYTPIVIGATSVTSSGVVTNGGILPITVYGPIGAAAGSIFWHDFNIYCDDTNVYLSHTYSGFGGTTGVTFAASTGWSSIKYYLLQETAV